MPPASNLILSELALVDLDDIATYTLIRWNAAQMQHYLQRIDTIINLLLANPMLGRMRPAISEIHRSYPCEEHMIFYFVRDNTVHISRILHGHMDVTSQVIP